MSQLLTYLISYEMETKTVIGQLDPTNHLRKLMNREMNRLYHHEYYHHGEI